jgi:hypothetical protein
MPAVQKVRSAASATMSVNNMKQIGIAMHCCHDAYGKLPGAAICDRNGKPLLSWRVAILPYIEQDNLYKQFKLDEPWDSANNKPLIARMPKIYSSPRYAAAEGMTCYKVFTGKNALFTHATGKRFTDVVDGLSNTVMAIEAGEPVVWTKPDDIEFDADKDLPKLDLPGGLREVHVCLGDGAVRRVSLDKISATTWKAVIGCNDGMITPLDWSGDEPGHAEARPAAVAPIPGPPTSRVAPPPPLPMKK